MPDVFMSHSSADAEIAGQVVSALEGDGLSCWIAPRDIGPGSWGDAIIRGIEACRAMVLLFSSSSNNSAHVLREVERAVNKKLTIIPFRIDDAGTNRDMEYFLSATQWLDARRPPLAERIAELVRQARSVLDAGKGVAAFAGSLEGAAAAMAVSLPAEVVAARGDEPLAANRETRRWPAFLGRAHSHFE